MGNNISKFFFIISFSICVFSSNMLFSQTTDADAYKKAEMLKDKKQRAEALKNFVSSYPESKDKVNALVELGLLYLDDNKIDSALIYADQAVKAVPADERMSLYNEISYALAQKKAGLDTAAVYAQRAVLLARESNSRFLSYILDTQALVLYNLGKPDSALILETEAIKNRQDSPSMLSYLAIYQEAAGHRLEGIKSAAKAILLGNTDEAVVNFNEWIQKEKPSLKERESLKKIIADSTLKPLLNNTVKSDKLKNQSTASLYLAYTNTNLKQAEKWAKAAVNSLNASSALEDRVQFTKNYGQVLFAEKKYSEALKLLNSIEDLADPWDSGFWYVLGQAYEKAGDNKKALSSYLSAYIMVQPAILQNAIKELASKEQMSDAQVTALVDQKRDELISFKPGQYKGGNNNHNIVLAELFTGAECGPCAGADYAFDDLSEYFSRNDLAILEYHLHIPAPDPLTNPDTFRRYTYYGKNFGTPTAFIQGKSKITGGGPTYMAKNRFNIYRHFIESCITAKPGVKINGTAKQSGDSVLISVNINKDKSVSKNSSLHTALVEKSIDYQGGNGVTNQIFVVRGLINGAEGSSVKTGKGSETISGVFSLSNIEKGLKDYLDDPTKDPSWRPLTPVPEWRKRTDKLNRSNLAVVTWVQDNKTKEVLQAYYIDIPAVNEK